MTGEYVHGIDGHIPQTRLYGSSWFGMQGWGSITCTVECIQLHNFILMRNEHNTKCITCGMYMLNVSSFGGYAVLAEGMVLIQGNIYLDFEKFRYQHCKMYLSNEYLVMIVLDNEVATDICQRQLISISRKNYSTETLLK